MNGVTDIQTGSDVSVIQEETVSEAVGTDNVEVICTIIFQLKEDLNDSPSAAKVDT